MAVSISAISTAQTPTKQEWGVKDTIIVSIINYEGQVMPYKELEMAYVSNLSPEQLAKAIAKYNRLRNAVYVTYPYARTAGATLNDVKAHLVNVAAKSDRKAYIKTREKELKQQFTDPLSNLSVYQGKVLMKLINRQTGNDCYDIIKEFKGSISARMYQTVAFFFGSSLKQPYDYIGDNTDRQIESIVKEIDGVWYQNPNRPITRAN
jgi:benzoyl-CoA reductase/2-hydroxyglutaryl-CoA dehydratase subunit BcrC/BadD/HgdB